MDVKQKADGMAVDFFMNKSNVSQKEFFAKVDEIEKQLVKEMQNEQDQA